MIATFFSTVLVLALGSGQAPKGPKLPFSDPGACPFECCQYGDWIAKAAQRAYETPRKGSDVAFAVRPGERVQALTGVVITQRAGIVIVRKRTMLGNVTVPAGGKLFVLHLMGEGDALFWYEGATHKGGLYAETIHKGSATHPWDVLSLPKTEWWVKIKTGKGATGWILDPRDFRGMDACGN